MTATSKKGAAALQDVLSAILNKRNWKQRVHIHTVFNFWNDVVGADIAAHARPDVIRGSVLWLKVSDQVWMHQLHLQKNTLLQKINEKLAGQVTIADIRFQVDVSLNDTKTAPAEKTVSPPPPEKVKEFEKLIDGLDDEKIKKSLLRLWLSFESK